jgi:RNA-dependent RNA polymerase
MMDNLSQGSTAFPCCVFRHLFMNTSEATSESETVDENDKTHSIKVHRLLLTPTQSRCIGVAMETGNRVLRRFTEDHGFDETSFLRVRLSDENGTTLYSDQLSPAIETRIREAATQGIEINGDRYQLLAYSSSQLKEYSFWMVKPMRGWRVEQIRADLGDFSKCISTAKLAARIGQCFSATFRNERPDGKFDDRFITSIRKPQVVEDIKASANDEKLHSDGTGLISRKLMDELLNGLPIGPADVSAVSIIQIRYGGAKGTLSAWKHLDLLPDRLFCRSSQIQIRKSMIKFEAKYRNIEVCSIGDNRPYFLNRNLILLLHSHGVADNVFLGMQRVMLNGMDTMLVSNEMARKLLPALSGADQSINNAMMTMLNMGLEPSRDPFLYGCLQSVRLHNIYNLRKKARIYIEKGVVLMGGLDETGEVPEGCVYVHIYKPCLTKKDTVGDSYILKGAVMVTKHPVMHPGDVRMLQAVDIPSLADHRNVILFSRHGSRPEANKMAGSDLDGDEFAVTWDSRLFLKQWNGCGEDERLAATASELARANADPMDYDVEASASDVIPSDPSHYSAAMIKHLINFMKNDNLGRIAGLWLDYASRLGADCQNCIRLAELHSVAVDFAKSGVPAQIPVELFLPQDFLVAHWREKKGAQRTMQCTSVIGKLYDEVVLCSEMVPCETAVAGRVVDKYGQILCSRVVVRETKLFKPETVVYASANDIYDASIPDRLGFSGLSEAMKDILIAEARTNLSEFESEVLMVANKYGIRSEGELFTGRVRKFHKLHSKNQNVIAEECRRACRQIQQVHRRFFFETVLDLKHHDGAHPADTAAGIGNIGDAEMDTNQLKELVMVGDQSESLRLIAFHLVAAYYIVTYDRNVSSESQALYSFPWILTDIVCEGLMANHGA